MNERDEIVLVEKIHNKVIVPRGAKPFSSMWIPKGGIDPGETPRSAAIRETKEEIQANPLLLHILGEIYNYDTFKIGTNGKPDLNSPKHIRIFGGISIQREFQPTHPNHPRAIWVPIANVNRYVKDEINRLAFDDCEEYAYELSGEMRSAMSKGKKNRKVFHLS